MTRNFPWVGAVDVLVEITLPNKLGMIMIQSIGFRKFRTLNVVNPRIFIWLYWQLVYTLLCHIIARWRSTDDQTISAWYMTWLSYFCCIQILIDLVFEMKSTVNCEVKIQFQWSILSIERTCHSSLSSLPRNAGLNPAVLKLDWSAVQQKLCWTCFTAEHDAEPKQAAA